MHIGASFGDMIAVFNCVRNIYMFNISMTHCEDAFSLYNSGLALLRYAD